MYTEVGKHRIDPGTNANVQLVSCTALDRLMFMESRKWYLLNNFYNNIKEQVCLQKFIKIMQLHQFQFSIYEVDCILDFQ